MGCNCGKRKNLTSATGLNGQYAVYRGDTYTGRSFTSLVNAEAYATRIGGEVRVLS